MRERLMKVYAILMTMALILFGVFFLRKAFVGKNVNNLEKINAQIDAASQNSKINAPGLNDSPPRTPPEAVPVPAAAVPVPVPAAASGAQPTPDAAQSVAPAATPSGQLPAKGGLGDAMKHIIEKRDAQKLQLEKSFNTPE